MNTPDISHEHAWARQGQMPRVLLGEAVRPFVATAHGADVDLPPQRPAAAPITQGANHGPNLAGLKQDEYGV